MSPPEGPPQVVVDDDCNDHDAPLVTALAALAAFFLTVGAGIWLCLG